MSTKFNIQQQPKTPGYLSCFIAEPGHKLVQSDLSAIEPHILAEFSRDPTMLKLYGPSAKPGQDIYLYNAAHIELFKDEIRKYYDPENPSPESVALAKKHCKQIRNFNKAITLSCGYGASAKKVRSMLITLGFPVTLQEAKVIHRDYWRLYSGIKRFQERLEMMWSENGGWVPNVLGRPIAVAAQYTNDIVNRFAQSSGHDVLQLYLYHTEQLRRERKVEMYPYIVDFHDEMIWSVPLHAIEAASQVMRDALQRTNDELEMSIKIKADVEVADNLAQIKCPDELKDWLAKKENP